MKRLIVATGIYCPPFARPFARIGHAVLLVAAAAATPLAFAPYYHFWLMPCLFALFIILAQSRSEIAVRSAYAYGLVSYAAQFYWIHTALHDIAGLPNLYALPLTLLLPAYLALYPALCFWLLQRSRLSPTWRIGALLPVLWTLGEYARERLFTGFGWGALGYSQIADGSPLAAYAPIGGVHLVTLLCAICAAGLALAVRGYLRALIAPAFIIVAGFFLRGAAFTEADGSHAHIALLQGNIPQHLKWTEAERLNTIAIYHALLQQHPADLVILPETALPLMRQTLQKRYPGVLEQFAATAQANGSALAVGIAQYSKDGSGYHNAVIDLSRSPAEYGNHPPFYAKNHLVPFGEYKPLPALTTPLYRRMNMPLADFLPGGEVQKPLAFANQQVAFNICYEDGFGDELIASARHATLLANVSNMGWYGQSNAMFQQLQQSQTRALELGRYMVRATNNGVTAIINPQGRVIAQAPTDSRTVLHGRIQGYRGQTPYMRMGGSWPLITILIVIALVLPWRFVSIANPETSP